MRRVYGNLACIYFRELLEDRDLKRHASTWPKSLSIEGKPGNLLFYEDPDHGFVLNALIKAPGLKTSVHDHGKSWTLYGVIEGAEKVVRFDRVDTGPKVPETAQLVETGSHDVSPGYIDFVPPWKSIKSTTRTKNRWLNSAKPTLRNFCTKSV